MGRGATITIITVRTVTSASRFGHTSKPIVLTTARCTAMRMA
jgi:hypothetical protein